MADLISLDPTDSHDRELLRTYHPGSSWDLEIAALFRMTESNWSKQIAKLCKAHGIQRIDRPRPIKPSVDHSVLCIYTDFEGRFLLTTRYRALAKIYSLSTPPPESVLRIETHMLQSTQIRIYPTPVPVNGTSDVVTGYWIASGKKLADSWLSAPRSSLFIPNYAKTVIQYRHYVRFQNGELGAELVGTSGLSSVTIANKPSGLKVVANVCNMHTVQLCATNSASSMSIVDLLTQHQRSCSVPNSAKVTISQILANLIHAILCMPVPPDMMNFTRTTSYAGIIVVPERVQALSKILDHIQSFNQLLTSLK